jgi:indole-3-glycerol phosphate synthase
MSGSGQTGTYLDRIMPSVMHRLEARKQARPLSIIESLSGPGGRASFAEAIAAPGVSLIAEVKRASPSRGPIRPTLDVGEIVDAYERGGARALSVLTEQDHFRGSIEDLERAVGASRLPVLRKDFIVDEYQIHEARVLGASAVLLIACLLSDGRLAGLAALARAGGLDVLLEVHDREELERALAVETAIIGVNNRDLRSFEVDLRTTVDLAPLVPPGRLLVGESGISTRADVEKLAACGADGVLVGEGLLGARDVERATRALLGSRRAGLARGVEDSCEETAKEER